MPAVLSDLQNFLPMYAGQAEMAPSIDKRLALRHSIATLLGTAD